MHSSSNRSILIISGLLTLLVLSGGALALGFTTAGCAAGRAQPLRKRSVQIHSRAIGPKPSAVGSTQTANQDEAAIYRQKLDNEYRALDDASAQIRVLQAPQVRLAPTDDGDERGIGQAGRLSCGRCHSEKFQTPFGHVALNEARDGCDPRVREQIACRLLGRPVFRSADHPVPGSVKD